MTVGSVDEALARLETGEAFDLVLADELMPVKGGLDLLAALRADPRTRRCPSSCSRCSAPITARLPT